VIFQHDHATTHSAQWTQVLAVVSIGTSGSSTWLFGSLKQHFRIYQVHSKEVALAIHEWVHMQDLDFYCEGVF
jgi:hypothetical protein